jgi:hypothetical protein
MPTLTATSLPSPVLDFKVGVEIINPMGVLEFVDKAPSRIGTAPLRSVFTTTLFNMIDLISRTEAS